MTELRPRLGVTLPNFRDEPESSFEIAHAADEAGLDGVFGFDHLFRIGRTGRRPALEGLTLLGAVAAETRRVSVGTLVARSTLRPHATLVGAFDALHRISGGRLIAGLGSGDSESRAEMETYGLPFGTMEDRLESLDEAVRASAGRGYPVWIGGAARHVAPMVAHADGWNRWGSTVELFAAGVARVRAVNPRVVCTWGGLVVLSEFEHDARRKAERLEIDPDRHDVIVGGPEHVAEEMRRYVAAGAEWIIAGPIDSTDPENTLLLGEAVLPLLT
ncbi:MAG: flavin-dependent oxidoreductase, F420-dependent methylene-tetrahydromethanopterin reductase [Actinomycetia bacterium]|nr:flavin-dependent oxidoreductase, F420-dependent methylene-tetrahydromethanopterin reductase [Actinomycetes bacterium]